MDQETSREAWARLPGAQPGLTLRQTRSACRSAAFALLYAHFSGGDGGGDTLALIYEQLLAEGRVAWSGVPLRQADAPQEAAEDAPTETDGAAGAAPSAPEEPFSLPLKAEDLAYIEGVRQGVCQRLPKLDAAIARASVGWSLERMARVDLTILRLAAYEILSGTAPVAVAVNEAVELANRYAEPDSGRFINGVLGAVARQEASAT